MKNIRIILVNTSHPGNIGSVARAMKTMGLAQLYLVAPKNFPAEAATMMAAGADDILQQVVVVENLAEAVADCQILYGTSARSRSLPWPMQWPKEAAANIRQQSQAQIGILFGREDKGLKNEELQLCHYHIQIPSSEEYASLNLAQAVQIIAYEIRLANLTLAPSDQGYDSDLADQHSIELFYQHLEKMLYRIEFLNERTPNRIMPRLRRLFNRAKPDTTEVAILRGILTEIERKL